MRAAKIIGPWIVLVACSASTAAPGSAGTSTTGSSSTAGSSSTTAVTGSGTSGECTPQDCETDGLGDCCCQPDGEGCEPVGWCMQSCEVPEDCAAFYEGRPAEDAYRDPTQWACDGGFCEYRGPLVPCEPALCAEAGGACRPIGGFSVCTLPCPDGDECQAPALECTDMDDDGNPLCRPAPCWGAAVGEPCEIPEFGIQGTCTADGSCTCDSDQECPVDGFSCFQLPRGGAAHRSYFDHARAAALHASLVAAPFRSR